MILVLDEKIVMRSVEKSGEDIRRRAAGRRRLAHQGRGSGGGTGFAQWREHREKTRIGLGVEATDSVERALKLGLIRRRARRENGTEIVRRVTKLLVIVCVVVRVAVGESETEKVAVGVAGGGSGGDGGAAR